MVSQKFDECLHGRAQNHNELVIVQYARTITHCVKITCVHLHAYNYMYLYRLIIKVLSYGLYMPKLANE